MPKILVVDDDGALRFDVTQSLAKWGFETRSAPGAILALRVIKEWKPLLVLCDIYMPHVSGLELKREISKMNIPPTEMGLIFITQLHHSQIDFNNCGVDVDAFVSKPLNYEILRCKVDAALRRIRIPQPQEARTTAQTLASIRSGTHA